MTISGNVPQHLVVAARTGFLKAASNPNMPWQKLTTVINMGAKSIDLVDLGASPMPVESLGKTIVQDFIERNLVITPKNWEITVGLSYNALQDDQTASLDRKVRGAGENFQRHMNNRIFQALDAGDTATYGLCYDGNEFFDGAHVDKGADYQTAQDNVSALALSNTNFNTVWVASKAFKDDRGEETDHDYNTLVVSPTLYTTAVQIAGNPAVAGTANRDVNPWSGMLDIIVSPKMNTTAWVLAATGGVLKPMLLAIREQPALQSSWFDPNGPDGGMYYFKFYARYNVFYGDWRLAHLGNT